MHHLVSREVIKDEAQRLNRIQARRHEHEFVLCQADVFGMTASKSAWLRPWLHVPDQSHQDRLRRRNPRDPNRE